MADIKKKKPSGTLIKSLNKSIKFADNSVKTASGEFGKTSSMSTGDPSEHMAEVSQNAEIYAASFAAKASGKAGKKLLKNSVKDAIHVKQRVETAKKSVKTVKQSIKTAKSTIKAGKAEIRATIKGGHASIKTSQAALQTAAKTGNLSIKTAQASAKAAIQTARTAAQAAKAALQVTAQVVRAAIKAAIVTAKAVGALISEAVEALAAAVAAGGWIVLVVILVVVLLAILIPAIFGLFQDVETDGQTFTNVKQMLNQEFADKIAETKSSMEYSRIEVYPAEIITEWDNISAIYSIRAMKNGEAGSEMTEDNIELLRETMWDFISITKSSEEATTVTEGAGTGEGETSEPVTETPESVGVITINYLSLDEAMALYGFTDEDKELLSFAQQLSVSIGSAGGGSMINPCPDGQFNGNDYPTYPSGGYHAGRDISCPIGTPIYAAADGVVIHINDQAATYGNHIMIAHGNQVYTLYAHCSELLVAVGDNVTQGQLIALSGNTGNVTGPHLHFEVRVGGSRYRVNNVDPLEWILQ